MELTQRQFLSQRKLLSYPMLLVQVVGGLVVEHTDAVVQMLPRMKKIKSSVGGGEGGMWNYSFLVHQQKEHGLLHSKTTLYYTFQLAYAYMCPQ